MQRATLKRASFECGRGSGGNPTAALQLGGARPECDLSADAQSRYRGGRMTRTPHAMTTMDERLIDLVRERPELYDTNSRLYSNNAHKNKVWDQIGRILRKTGQDCKQRWTSLRSQHRKAKVKFADTGRKWRYEDQMSFLNLFKKEKQRPTPFNTEEDDECDNEDENGEDIDMWEETIKPLDSTIIPSTSTVAPRKFIRQRKVKQTAASTLMRYVLENKNENQKEKSSIELFFLTMANTVKTFSAYDQHLVKNEVFQVVSRMEAKYVMSQESISQDDFHINDEQGEEDMEMKPFVESSNSQDLIASSNDTVTKLSGT